MVLSLLSLASPLPLTMLMSAGTCTLLLSVAASHSTLACSSSSTAASLLEYPVFTWPTEEHAPTIQCQLLAQATTCTSAAQPLTRSQTIWSLLNVLARLEILLLVRVGQPSFPVQEQRHRTSPSRRVRLRPLHQARLFRSPLRRPASLAWRGQ